MLVGVVIPDRSYCFMVPPWSAFLVHYLLHSNKHLLLSLQRRITSIVVVYVVPWGTRSFSFFYLRQCTCRVSALLGQLCLLHLSLLFLLRYTPQEYGGTSSSLHAYMHGKRTRIRCTPGNERIFIRRKKIFLRHFPPDLYFLFVDQLLFIRRWKQHWIHVHPRGYSKRKLCTVFHLYAVLHL